MLFWRGICGPPGSWIVCWRGPGLGRRRRPPYRSGGFVGTEVGDQFVEIDGCQIAILNMPGEEMEEMAAVKPGQRAISPLLSV